ncbi:uncharacterized protein LOC106693603 [Microplitis demolitor]|uniref:uncharacterized protein LOC106693603 n=1 Tax=Microplitis demolitor TaxID=69319 RepID=UPI0006D520E0|nr:uncharacterized protein LOC106693603 [Microplitis demolitor]
MPSGLICDPNPLFIDDSIHYIHPYIDSASWLYLETEPIVYPSSSRDNQYHRHCRHHHHHLNPRHRRIASDPGGLIYLQDTSYRNHCSLHHRRGLSLSGNDVVTSCLDEVINEEANEDYCQDEAGQKTPTFRKVPWHHNLHMLKTRQT